MLGSVLKQALVHSMELSPTKMLQGASVVSVHVRYKRNSSNSGRLGETPHNRAEMQKLGMMAYMKKYRQYAQYNYEEWRYPQKRRAIDISCTREVHDSYKDDKRSGVQSLLYTPRKQLVETKNDVLSNRILKKRVPEFHRRRFPAQAQEIYVDAHNLLNTENWTVVKKPETEEKLDKLVTEHAYMDMVKGLDSKTVIWKYVETIEPARVVRIRCPSMLNEDNYYGQVTVRFHSKQMLAIYDRFGRLMYGTIDSPRNVLEYVVFERHISHPYGIWRVHAKIHAEQYTKEPTRQTVSVRKTNTQREAAKAWHEEEEEKSPYKWYPSRHHIIKIQERLKRTRRGHKYWKKRRKYIVLNVKRVRSPKMRGKVQRMADRKREEIFEKRKAGFLSDPPEHRD